MAYLEYHYETMGRILAHLVENGLTRVNIETTDAMVIMTEKRGDEEAVYKTFADVFHWMSEEGLIRHGKTYDTHNQGFCFLGVQLTSLGLAVINTKITNSEIGATIEQTITQKPEGGLSSETYGKIGSLVGGIIGGAAQSLG